MSTYLSFAKSSKIRRSLGKAIGGSLLLGALALAVAPRSPAPSPEMPSRPSDAGAPTPSSDEALAEAAALQGPLSTVIAPMNSLEDLDFTYGTATVAAEGSDGQKVLRFDQPYTNRRGERRDAGFEARIDLAQKNIDLEAYDLLKIEVKADRAATLLFSTDNYPTTGTQARWYALDALRGPFDWKTIYLDLHLPEEIKTRASSPQSTLVLTGHIKDTGRALQGAERRIWIGEIRAVKQAVALDWDQKSFTYTWDTDGDLVYSYPLTVTNRLDTSVTALLSLEPFQTQHATAALSATRITLEPGEQAVVHAAVRLPASVSANAPPLYTERFEAHAEAEGLADSTVPILRSSDTIHLPVTVPIPEERMRFPLFPTPRELPPGLLFFDESLARRHAAASPEHLIAGAMARGIFNYIESRDDPSFRAALVSAAYLYNLTGEQPYFELASTLLNALPDIWNHHHQQYQDVPHPLVSSGIIVRWNQGWHFTLGLGWRLMGTQRSPYQYSYDANARGGTMSAILYAFDMLAPELEPAQRTRFIEAFLLPAGIRSRNHYVGDGNQQATVNTVALYAGLAARNWPLVAFAHSSEHGYPGIIAWTFTDQGVHIRNRYQTYTLRPLFWTAELLYGRGINVYEDHKSRLQRAVAQGFSDGHFWNFVLHTRLATDPRSPSN